MRPTQTSPPSSVYLQQEHCQLYWWYNILEISSLSQISTIVPPLVLPSPEAEYLSSTLNGIENPDVAVSHWTTKVGSAEERPEGQSGK